MNKKIVFVVSAMSRGGAERVISILSNHYVKEDYDIDIVMLWHSHVEYELDPNVNVVDLSNDKVRPMFRLLSVTQKLRKYLKKAKPHAVVSFIAQNNMVSGMACKGLKTRFIPSERIDPSFRNTNFLFNKIINSIYAKSTVTVLQTERAKRYFPEKIQKNSIVIGNPISVKEYADKDYQFKFVTAGRLQKQKNHRMLIKAFKAVHDKYPEFSLTIYGEGTERQALEDLVSNLGLDGCVQLPGNVPDIHSKIKDAYAFVLSSDFEGLSNALLEAMMMGLPCISTDCAGSDEVIKDGENGFIVPVGNEEKMREAMLRLAADEDLRNSIARASGRSVDKYRVDNVIQQWTDAIKGEQ